MHSRLREPRNQKKNNFTFKKILAEIQVQIWPIGSARDFEIEDPNLLWLILRLSSICVPDIITFYGLP